MILTPKTLRPATRHPMAKPQAKNPELGGSESSKSSPEDMGWISLRWGGPRTPPILFDSGFFACADSPCADWPRPLGP